MTMLQKPTVLILGSTGEIGRFILEYLKREPDAVHIRVTARRPEQVATFQQQGQDAVLLDLDSPATFAAALCGVDRVFLLTGYTVAMLAQSKTFIDAARKARIQHIVHLGVFGHWDAQIHISLGTSWSKPTSRQAASRGRTSIQTCSWSRSLSS
jgi:NAD(P)H dehydrogenase (quinone)